MGSCVLLVTGVDVVVRVVAAAVVCMGCTISGSAQAWSCNHLLDPCPQPPCPPQCTLLHPSGMSKVALGDRNKLPPHPSGGRHYAAPPHKCNLLVHP